MEITMTDISKKQRARIYIYKAKKMPNVLIYTKSRTLRKNKDNYHYVFIFKKPETLRYKFFINILILAFIYKKNDTLRYVKFLYTIIQTLHKKQDNLRYVFIYKNPDILRYAISLNFLNWRRGRVFLYAKKKHFALHFYIQKTIHFALRYIFKKPDTLRYILYAKTMRFALRLYIYDVSHTHIQV